MILALRALGVGDLATGVPALRGLRAAFPGEHLALATPAWLTPLAGLIGGIDRIIPADGLGTPLPRLEPPSIAVNLHGRGPQSHRLLRATEPRELWAFEVGDGPSWRDDEHEVHRWCRLLDHYRVPAAPDDLSLAVPDVPVPHGVTIIHPGAKSPTRRWPPDRFAAVARHLSSAGHQVVISGSAAEHSLAVRVATAAGLGRAAVLSTDLASLAALVAHARLLISGDTGIAHLATAYHTPSVVLFGPMSPARWGPPPRPYHRAIWHGTRSEPGNGPDTAPHRALLAIGDEEVIAAADSVRNALRGSACRR